MSSIVTSAAWVPVAQGNVNEIPVILLGSSAFGAPPVKSDQRKVTVATVADTGTLTEGEVQAAAVHVPQLGLATSVETALSSAVEIARPTEPMGPAFPRIEN